MPTYKVGARGEGVVSALLDYVKERQADQADRTKRMRDQNDELIKAGIKAAFDNRDIVPDFDQAGNFRGFRQDTSPKGPQTFDEAMKAYPGASFNWDPQKRQVSSVSPKPIKELSPRDQLFSDIQESQKQVANAKQFSSSLLASSPPRFGVSERALEARPSALQRAAFGPLEQAQKRLHGFQSQAGTLNQAGLLGTPGTIALPTEMSPETQSVLEDLQSGQGTIEEFIANESDLQASGVDTDAVRQMLGI